MNQSMTTRNIEQKGFAAGHKSGILVHGRTGDLKTMTRLKKFVAAGGVMLATLSLAPVSASAQEPMLGQVQDFGFNFCPRGWAEANGQLLPINGNQALFSLLGTLYGGDGRTTFALPDLVSEPSEATPEAGSQTADDRSILTTCIALVGIYPSRS